jgi:rubrerythrin
MEDNNIINLDDYRRDKEEEQIDQLEDERHFLGDSLRNLLAEIRAVEDRTERLRNQEQIRAARYDIAEEDAQSQDSWFTRTLNYIVRDKTPQDD